jgi:hypothetical protein
VKGRVVWQPPGLHWFVVVEQTRTERRSKGRECEIGQGRFCVVELPHPHRRKATRVSGYSTDRKRPIEEAKRRNGELHIYYMGKGAFLPGGLYGPPFSESHGY